jgi:hypothetical protein
MISNVQARSNRASICDAALVHRQPGLGERGERRRTGMGRQILTAHDPLGTP